jgi:hypothetical protein
MKLKHLNSHVITRTALHCMQFAVRAVYAIICTHNYTSVNANKVMQSVTHECRILTVHCFEGYSKCMLSFPIFNRPTIKLIMKSVHAIWPCPVFRSAIIIALCAHVAVFKACRQKVKNKPSCAEHTIFHISCEFSRLAE